MKLKKSGAFFALVALYGCGSSGSSETSVLPPNMVEARQFQDAIHARTLETMGGSTTISPRLVPFSFTATDTFTRASRGYSFYGNPGLFRYESNVGESNQIWTPPVASFQALSPSIHSDLIIDGLTSRALENDGNTLTVTNSQTGNFFTLSGLAEPLAAANVTYTIDQTFTDNGKIWKRYFSGVATCDSGWRIAFTKLSTVDSNTVNSYSQADFSTITLVQPNVVSQQSIGISGHSLSHTSNNTTFDFDITMVNATLQGWGVQVKKEGQTVKTLTPTTDPRGPGTATGTNPVHVKLNWDGLDENNQAVTGNITWVTTANTTTFVQGGPLNDGINSVQATKDDSIDTDLRLEVYENKSNGVKLASSRHTYEHIVPGDLRDELDNVCADSSIRVVLSGVPDSQTSAVGDLKVSLGNVTDKPVTFQRKGGAFEAILDMNALANETAERSTYHVVDSSFPPDDANEFAAKLRGRGFSQAGRLFEQNNPYDPSLVLLRSQLFGTQTFDDLDAVKVTAKKVAMAGYQTLRVHYDPHDSQLGLMAELEAMLRVKRQATALYIGGHGTFTGLKLPSVAFKKFGEFQQELFPADWAHLKVVVFGACTVANLNNYQNNPTYQRDGSPDPVDPSQNKEVIPLEQIPSYSPARLVDAATNRQAIVLGYSSTAPSGPGILQSLTQLPYDQQILQDYFIKLGGATVDQVHDSPLAWLEANAAIDFFDNACAFDKEGYYYIDYRIRNAQGWFGRTFEEHYDRAIAFVPRSRWDLPLKADHRPVRVKKLDTVYLRVVPK